MYIHDFDIYEHEGQDKIETLPGKIQVKGRCEIGSEIEILIDKPIGQTVEVRDITHNILITTVESDKASESLKYTLLQKGTMLIRVGHETVTKLNEVVIIVEDKDAMKTIKEQLDSIKSLTELNNSDLIRKAQDDLMLELIERGVL